MRSSHLPFIPTCLSTQLRHRTPGSSLPRVPRPGAPLTSWALIHCPWGHLWPNFWPCLLPQEMVDQASPRGRLCYGYCPFSAHNRFSELTHLQQEPRLVPPLPAGHSEAPRVHRYEPMEKPRGKAEKDVQFWTSRSWVALLRPLCAWIQMNEWLPSI